MISLEVNGTFVDLIPGENVSITMVNPMFDRAGIDRVYSLPFRIPATPRNIAVLGPFDRVDADHAARKVAAALFISGTLFDTGFLRLVGVSWQAAEFMFQSAGLEARERLQGLRLRSLPGVIEVSEPYRPQITASAAHVFPFSELFMSISINGQVFTAEVGDRASLVAAINAVWPGIASDGGQTSPVPDLVVNTLIIDPPGGPDTFIFQPAPAVDDPEAHIFFAAFTTSTYAAEVARIGADWESYLETPNAFAAFPVIFAPDFYGEKNELFSGYLNYTDPAGEHPNNYADPIADESWEHTVVPLLRVPFVLDLIGEALGIRFAGEFLADEETRSLLIWSNRALDVVRWPTEYLEGSAPFDALHTYQADITTADHLPDITALELLIRLMDTFALMPVAESSTKTIRLEPVAPLLAAPPKDWTMYADPRFRARFDPEEGFSLDYDRQRDETAVAGQLERVEGGPGSMEIVSGFYSLFETRRADDNRSWLVPFINETGTSDFFDAANQPSMRLVFDRGLQADSQGNSYNLATHGALDYARQPVGAYSLDWQGEAGLLKKWWKPLLSAMSRNATVKLEMRLPVAELLELRTWRSVTRYVYTERGQIIGAIRSVSFSATPEGLGMAEVELQKL
jgi:hypothetical protein